MWSWMASESKWQYIDFAKKMEAMGVKTIIVTDISKDGTMMGPNVEMLAELKKNVSMQIVASGGIKDITHIKALKDLDIYGAITGKAMYAKTYLFQKQLLYVRRTKICTQKESIPCLDVKMDVWSKALTLLV